MAALPRTRLFKLSRASSEVERPLAFIAELCSGRTAEGGRPQRKPGEALFPRHFCRAGAPSAPEPVPGTFLVPCGCGLEVAGTRREVLTNDIIVQSHT